ncbi:MAG: tRNA uridine-5-carboxymethylaminomethyl(34) synthesis enzyme MnmG [Defluviitaleaceae bacterium]|nr:tRNA uridine-5-carboxymethylaminomethyl(34) synthesis enzyme MnmG [Defluviitaleaceae bacterium]MCL2274994.1 tRNA uridine-5-carboxymethylaminomethyl(34) synthesis enzyme MnmG [Defluviitaleaceae bacterium]
MKHIVIIGGGHAGCEAALAAARIGRENIRVTLFAMSLDSIAMMPCNPCIGGSAKGHLVREIDALGGEMGRAIDATFLQSRMLNASKGPAVYSLRAQADKKRYMQYMKRVLENTPNLFLREGEVLEIIVVDGERSRITGVRVESGAVIACDTVVVCSGTYLHARCLYGETVNSVGPSGQRSARKLSENLRALGFTLQRFKTGTPARVHKRSIDFSKMAKQDGDINLVPFSFETDPAEIHRPQLPCYLTYTTHETHEIIRANLHRSAMYSGLIDATGTRYCPSIEDKIVRFADKERHPVFIEPEGEDTQEMYVQGMSSALPEDVQIQVYRSVPGLENCEIMRPAYAIEYDCIDATMLTPGLEAKHIRGLFFAGQINGSSGYEEAAAQGLLAGANAALTLCGNAPMQLTRAQGYIGVLVDDLVTKGTQEPYRMMTSRAEYRLLLRQDNADLRLTPLGYQSKLISEKRYAQFQQKQGKITQEIIRMKSTVTSPEGANPMLAQKGSAPIMSGIKLADLIKRPELTYWDVAPLAGEAVFDEGLTPYVRQTICEQVNIQLKYEGYIAMQQQEAEQFAKAEARTLPPDLDYESITGLRLEARQKLAKLRPANFGQASRITGVSPADLSVLMIYMKTREGDRERSHA